jgi:hypothetical protein
MSDETSSPAGGEAIYSTELPADAPETFATPTEAAEYFTNLKAKRASQAERAPVATAEPESSQEDSDPVTAPAEEPEEAEPAEVPPIDPPRSWTQAEKERFQSLPRETQEYLSHREQERETALRRSQNEIAEQRKAIEAEREAAAKVRQQYEAQLPNLLRELESVNQAQFGDIRTMDDVVQLQTEDPFRFQAWQVHQMRLQTAKQEADKAEGQKAQEKQTKRQAYEAEQNRRLVELVPEMADPKKANDLRTRAVAMLTDDLGFSNDELSGLMQDDTGFKILSDARWQKLIADGLKYRDIQKAPKAVAKPDLPPVQRPGTSKPAGSVVSERLQALNNKPELTVNEATELYMLQQRASRRAS